MTQFRDLTILPLTGTTDLVIACDSSAAIGEKPADQVQVSPRVTAAFCLRVPLMELLSVGAEPLAVVDLIGNEYEQTGRQMLEGIRGELVRAGLEELPINGSTEENMVTEMSTIGITVIGKVTTGKAIYGELIAGDQLFYLGQPYVGEEVLAHLDTIFSYADLKRILKADGVKEVLPVGSKGILYEANCLANSSQLVLDVSPKLWENSLLQRSAGPATVLVIGVSSSHSIRLAHQFNLTYLGNVKEMEDLK